MFPGSCVPGSNGINRKLKCLAIAVLYKWLFIAKHYLLLYNLPIFDMLWCNRLTLHLY